MCITAVYTAVIALNVALNFKGFAVALAYSLAVPYGHLAYLLLSFEPYHALVYFIVVSRAHVKFVRRKLCCFIINELFSLHLGYCNFY